MVQLNLFPRLWLSRAVRKIILNTANMVQFMLVCLLVLASGQVGPYYVDIIILVWWGYTGLY